MENKFKKVEDFMQEVGSVFDIDSDYYQRLAEGGDLTAQMVMMNYCRSEGDILGERMFAAMAAKQGNIHAMETVVFVDVIFEGYSGHCMGGPSGEYNIEAGAEWLDKAIEAGSLGARAVRPFFRALYPESSHDVAKAIVELEDLSLEGYTDGWNLLGIVYSLGLGVEADKERACEYYERVNAVVPGRAGEKCERYDGLAIGVDVETTSDQAYLTCVSALS